MMSASVAGRFPARSRLGHDPRRPPMFLHRPAPGQSRLPVAAIVLSMALHVLFFAIVAALAMWAAWSPRKPYVVNLVPMVAAVGVPNAPRVSSVARADPCAARGRPRAAYSRPRASRSPPRIVAAARHRPPRTGCPGARSAPRALVADTAAAVTLRG